MSLLRTLEEFQDSQGWQDKTLLVLLAQYLDEHAAPSSVRAFLSDRCAEEEEPEEEPEERYYRFPVEIGAHGRNALEAWNRAVEGFNEDPGECPEPSDMDE